MLPSSQSWTAGIDNHTSTGMISPLTTVTNRHPTPPRVNGNTLPSTPSSERLRRVAPSPIVIIPWARLRFSPPSPSQANQTPPRQPPRPSVAQNLSFSLRQQERAPSVYDDGEEELRTIVQSYIRHSNSHTDGPRSDEGEDDVQVPIILDDGSRASEIAIRNTITRNPGPQERSEDTEAAEFLNVSPSAREGEENMTPGEFFRAFYKPQVMVRFNTNVFGAPAPGEPVDESDNGPLEPTSPDSEYDDDDERSDRKASTCSSFYAPERRLTDFSEFEYDETVRNTVIDEEEDDNDETPRATDSISDPMLALPLPIAGAGPPALDDTDQTSPESINTELITPAHDDVPLPTLPRGSSEQGVQRPLHRFDGRHVDKRFLPAKSSFRPSTAPVEGQANSLAPAAITIPKRPRLIAPTPRNNTSEGLQLDTTGRRSIDVDRERAIEHAGGTPGRPSRVLESRTTPPVPPLPPHLINLPKPTTEVEFVDKEHVTLNSEINRLLDELEDPDVTPCPTDSEAEQDEAASQPKKPWPEDLAKVDRNTTLELIVNQDSGVPVWCTLPVRRLSRPEYWQDKEDQELAKAIRWRDPPPKPQPFQRTGAVIFGQPPKRRTKWIFFYSSKSIPTLKGVVINNGTGKDHTRGTIKLNIKHAGVYSACGYDEAGQVEWMFQYLVTLRQGATTRRRKRARNVYPMDFFAVAGFLDPSRGQHIFPFSKAFQPVYESERMPVPRIGRPPIHTAPPAWNIEQVRSERRAGRAGTSTIIQAPPTSAVGRMFSAITGMKRSRPNTPASVDDIAKISTTSRPGTASSVHGRSEASGSHSVRSGGLLGGLRNKLAKRPDTSTGIVSIAPSIQPAPLALRSRDDLQLERFDTMASGKSGSGKSIKGMMSKLLRPPSRPGSAKGGLFLRNQPAPPLGSILPAAGLGRRRSKSAASAMFPARASPSSLGFVREEPVSDQVDPSSVDEPTKSNKTIMGRIRTFSVGARPGSRSKSPLAVESVVGSEPSATEEGTNSAKAKGVAGRLRSLSGASRPGSSRLTPVEHPDFDLEELLSARETSGSALGIHDPVTSFVKQTYPKRPGMPRSDSSRSQISPTPPFVLEDLLRARAIGSSDSLAASIASSPILTPAKWKGKGKEIIPEIKVGRSARPGSSRESPVWFAPPKVNSGSSRSISTLADDPGPSGTSNEWQRPAIPRLQSMINQVKIVPGESSHRNSITLKHSSLSVQDLAEYVDGKFSSSTLSTLDESVCPSSGLDDRDQNDRSIGPLVLQDVVEMSRTRKDSLPRIQSSSENTTSTDVGKPISRAGPLDRRNTFDRLLETAQAVTTQAINESVQRIVEENNLFDTIPDINSVPVVEDDTDDGFLIQGEQAAMSATSRESQCLPPASVEALPEESVELPRSGGSLTRIKSLASINPNILKSTPLAIFKPTISDSPRARPFTGNSHNKENEPITKIAQAGPNEASAPISTTPSLWQRLTRPRSLSNLKAALVTPSKPIVDTPPLPSLPKPAHILQLKSSVVPGDNGSYSPRSAKSISKRPATSAGAPERPPLPRSTASSSSVSSMAKSASTIGIVLMQNTASAHLRDCHPFAVAIRPIEGRIEGSEWTNLNPQPTHYLVEDPVFKKAMEEHREEMRNTAFPPPWNQIGAGPSSASSATSSTSGTGNGRPPLKPILRKRPSTAQVEHVPKENLDPDLSRHLWPNKWISSEVSPVPSPLSSSGPVPPKRGRPSTAQVHG